MFNFTNIILITCFILYCVIRILLLIHYLTINSESHADHFEKFLYEASLHLEYCYKNKSHIIFIPPIITPGEKNKERWLKVYSIDKKVKSIGSIALSIIAIYVSITGVMAKAGYSLLLPALLPSFIQIFNEIFSWYEIDEPSLQKPMLPIRIIAKNKNSERKKILDLKLQKIENELIKKYDDTEY